MWLYMYKNMYKLKHYNWDKFVSSICAGVDCIKTINGSLKGRGLTYSTMVLSI